jgi:hypothetical protein
MLILSAILAPAFLLGDISETIFIPKGDFTTGIFHFYHQGDKAENYGFLFGKDFDKKRIVYAQPSEYKLETLEDGRVKLIFSKTDHYSYLQQAYQDDFVVGQVGNSIKFLISGGDCIGKENCTTKTNILTAIIPSGYRVINYKGLDQDLKELKVKEWKIKGEIYTLVVPDVKGACLYMEVEKNTPQVSSNEKIPTIAPLVASKSAMVYQNNELFEKGDAVLSASGIKKIEQLRKSVKENEKVLIGVFQDCVAPKRLAAKYPTAQKFSQARATSIYNELIKGGLSENKVRFEVIDKRNEKTRVEAIISPVL